MRVIHEIYRTIQITFKVIAEQEMSEGFDRIEALKGRSKITSISCIVDAITN